MKSMDPRARMGRHTRSLVKDLDNAGRDARLDRLFDQLKRRRAPMPITYTDGAQYVAEAGSAYWLLDAIVSHEHDARVRREPFQVWTLRVAQDHRAMLTCEDGDHGFVASQAIAFSDFPLPEITLWLQNNVIFLPSEY